LNRLAIQIGVRGLPERDVLQSLAKFCHETLLEPYWKMREIGGIKFVEFAPTGRVMGRIFPKHSYIGLLHSQER
jgi:hypothetical protein